VEFGVDLAHPVHAVVVGVHGADLFDGGLISTRAQRRGPGLGRVVVGRGDVQRGADLIGPDLMSIAVAERDYLMCGRSSSAAKKAEADFRMALARRSSRTSRASSARRWAWSVVVPGRSPASTSAWVTQLRSVSRLMPS